jgi:hypothetical protein
MGVSVPYGQSATFAYSAPAAPGPAYPSGRASIGDPLFTHVLSDVALGFDYSFHSSAASSLAGRAVINAKITSSNGWQMTMPLGAATPFRGDEVRAQGRLELPSILALMQRIEKTTAVNGSYTLTVEPAVNSRGRLADLPLSVSFSPKILFSLNALELRPLSSSGAVYVPGQRAASPFSPAASASLPGKRRQALFLSFGLFRLHVAAARRIGLGGVGLVLCLLGAAMAFVRPRRAGELDQLVARYARLIVPVSRFAAAGCGRDRCRRH